MKMYRIIFNKTSFEIWMFSFQKVHLKLLSAVLLPCGFRGSWIYSHIACGNGGVHLENKKIKPVHAQLAWGKMNTFLHYVLISQIDMMQTAVNKPQLSQDLCVFHRQYYGYWGNHYHRCCCYCLCHCYHNYQRHFQHIHYHLFVISFMNKRKCCG